MKELNKLIKESLDAQRAEIDEYLQAFGFDYDLGDENDLVNDAINDLQISDVDSDAYSYLLSAAAKIVKDNSRFEDHSSKAREAMDDPGSSYLDAMLNNRYGINRR